MHGRASLWVLVALSWTCVPVQDHPAGDQEDSPAKRSIALVDEDFDVPQVHDVAEYGNAVDDDFPGPWGGSGEKGVETELTEEEPTTMSTETRETVQETAATAPTRNATDRSKTKTRETVQETTATEPTRNATDRSKTKTRETVQETTATEPTRNATDGSKTKSKTTRSSKATAALLTKNASGSTDVTITSTETSDSVGGSGDASVSSEQPTTPDDGFADDFDYVSELCWNTTCEDADLWVQPEGMALVAEGTNLTLTCRGNLTDHEVLYWYRGSNSTLHEQAFAVDQGLLLNVPDARAFHSGLYRCVRWVGVQICCNREIRITVYEVPSYKYHIIIGALVAASLLLACVWLQVRQTKRYAVYSKEFATKHGKAENLLWK